MADHESLIFRKKQKRTVADRALSIHARLRDEDVALLRNPPKRMAIHTYRFMLLLGREFLRTGLTRRASALTYTTILSIFPLLAVVGSVAIAFLTTEREQAFRDFLEDRFIPSANMNLPTFMMSDAESGAIAKQKEMTENARKIFNDVMTKFRSGAGGTGAFGFIGLLVASGLLFYSIESTVNNIWQCEHRANWKHTIRSFMLTLVLVPFVIVVSIASSGIAVSLLKPDDLAALDAPIILPVKQEPSILLTTQTITDPMFVGPASDDFPAPQITVETPQPSPAPVKVPSKFMGTIRSFTTAFGFVLPLIPIGVNSLLLALAFSTLPNTRVLFKYALMGGVVTALLWEAARSVFFLYIYASTINRTLADAFGLSVIFLIWIYITWLVLLLGNLVVYTAQNFGALWAESITGKQMLLDGRLLVAVMVLLARRFANTGGGLGETELRERLGMSQDIFNQIIRRLTRGGYVTVLSNDGYQIGHPLDRISVRELLAMGCNLTSLPIAERGKGSVAEIFSRLQEETLRICNDCTLADLLSQGTGSSSSASSPVAGTVFP